MGGNKYALLFIFLVPALLLAQKGQDKYIVYFSGKSAGKGVEKLFSKKAIEKRAKFRIPFDDRDYPVETGFVDALRSEGISVLSQSNWLNAVMVTTDEGKIRKIKKLPFIASVKKVEKSPHSGKASIEEESECEEVLDYEDNYTSSFPQFHLMNGEYLHEQGFNGEEMTIAICDEGFKNANTNPAFSHIFSENRILGTYDYVHGDSAVYGANDGSHGSNCFSFIGAIKSNQYIGTSTKSDFYLFHTENNDGGSERLQEEFLLATALERCSQLGVDVVSISLGYTTFDVASENHDTSDMMKNNTPAAIAVNTASSKGMLVVVAAGNLGNNPWHYISTPADADSAFAIASVDINGNPSGFSGWGLATDPRVKPNVAAVGSNAAYVDISGNIQPNGAGTSYACPSVAGLTTCLWQAFPTKTNWEIKTAIEQSASQYLTPDKKIGYGIPDFRKAYEILSNPTFVSNSILDDELTVYPNPFRDNVSIYNSGSTIISNIRVLNNIGEIVYSQNNAGNALALNDLPKGMYLMQVSTNHGLLIKKLIKD